MLRSIQLSFILFSIWLIAGNCGSSGKKDFQETIKGNWLIVYPDHKLKSEEE